MVGRLGLHTAWEGDVDVHLRVLVVLLLLLGLLLLLLLAAALAAAVHALLLTLLLALVMLGQEAALGAEVAGLLGHVVEDEGAGAVVVAHGDFGVGVLYGKVADGGSVARLVADNDILMHLIVNIVEMHVGDGSAVVDLAVDVEAEGNAMAFAGKLDVVTLLVVLLVAAAVVALGHGATHQGEAEGEK